MFKLKMDGFLVMAEDFVLMNEFIELDLSDEVITIDDFSILIFALSLLNLISLWVESSNYSVSATIT